MSAPTFKTFGWRLARMLFAALLIPLGCVLVASQSRAWANSATGIIVASFVAYGCLMAFVLWRLALFCRFSLKSLLLATFGLNICISLIVVPENLNWRVLGAVLLFVWFAVVGVSLLHSGVTERFKAMEKRELEALLSETKNEPER